MSAFDAAAFQARRRGSFGADLRVSASLGSTQDAAREALSQGAGAGLVVLAEAQEQGRGRWGRRWEGKPGHSLLFTVALPSRALLPASLPLYLGLASGRALRGMGLEEVRLKWPNDLWWRDRKLGGLLVESAGPWALAGCGLNVGQSEADLPQGLERPAASLALAGLEAPREAVLAALLASWEAEFGLWQERGLEPFLGLWEGLDALAGRSLRVRTPQGLLEGRCLGLAPDGALRLGLPDGAERRLYSAEIEEVRPAGAD